MGAGGRAVRREAVVVVPAAGGTSVSLTDERDRVEALEDRVLVLEACLLEIERRLKIKRRPGAVPTKFQPPPPPAPEEAVPKPERSKPRRTGTPAGGVQRSKA